MRSKYSLFLVIFFLFSINACTIHKLGECYSSNFEDTKMTLKFDKLGRSFSWNVEMGLLNETIKGNVIKEGNNRIQLEVRKGTHFIDDYSKIMVDSITILKIHDWSLFEKKDSSSALSMPVYRDQEFIGFTDENGFIEIRVDSITSSITVGFDEGNYPKYLISENDYSGKSFLILLQYCSLP